MCISTKMSTPEKVGGAKHMASRPVQKVGGHVPLSTHGSTPVMLYITSKRLQAMYQCEFSESELQLLKIRFVRFDLLLKVFDFRF